MPKTSKSATEKKPKPTSASSSKETDSSTKHFEPKYDVKSSPSELLELLMIDNERDLFRDAANYVARRIGRPRKPNKEEERRMIFMSTQVDPEFKFLLHYIQDETGMSQSDILRRALGIFIDTYIQIKKEEGVLA